LYLPHLQKVNELSRPFNLLKARFKAVLDVLDRFHLGVFILATDRSVVVHNHAADRILELQDGIHNIPGKMLGIKNPSQHLIFTTQIDKAISLAKGDEAGEIDRIAITRPSGKTAFIVEISAVRSRNLVIDGIFTGAMIIVIDPDHHPIIDTAGLEMLFNLTPAEQQVCKLLIEGYATREIAECRDSSPETVRNQIKALLDKTKSRHRADLVRLALSINLPVDSEDRLLGSDHDKPLI
jgi:DNA-binding CsgD family transcriptional regulator